MHSPLKTEIREPNTLTAWLYLVRLSFVRQARAHLMVWIALALLGFTFLIVAINTQAGRWGMAHWTWPRFQGQTFAEHLRVITKAEMAVPWPESTAAVLGMQTALFRATLDHAAGFFVFSNWIVFGVFSTFLLPLCSLSFATEGLGREREAHNLLWVLTRPLSRPSIYLAKLVALLPWCVMLNLGGFALVCLAGGEPGRMALRVYWPAVLCGTLAFASFFHLLGACVRRPAVVALLYAFFLETIMSNLPGDFKRFSISYYIRCLMFERAHEFGIHPERAQFELPVSGTTALLVLAGTTVVCAVIGAVLFTRNEYLDLS